MAGAIYSGFAMVLVLAIPLRKVYGLEGLITQRHLDNSAKIMLATGMILRFPKIVQDFRLATSLCCHSGRRFLLTCLARVNAPRIRNRGACPDQFQQEQIAAITSVAQQFDVPRNLQYRILIVPIWPAPDGRSLVTSVGISDSRVWVHDDRGDRQIASEGVAYFPAGSTHGGRVFSPDGTKLYFLVKRQTSAGPGSAAELWQANLTAGTSERLFPGISVIDYDIFPDGKRVVFAAREKTGRPRLWVAALDRRSPPRQLSNLEADVPCVAGDDTVFFRVNEGSSNFSYRIQGRAAAQKIIMQPIITLLSCSPDGEWVLAGVPSTAEERTTRHVAFSTRGAPPVPLCDACDAVWSRDGRFLYIMAGAFGGMRSEPKTYAIRLRPGAMVPKPPPGGITPENLTSLPVAKVFKLS